MLSTFYEATLMEIDLFYSRSHPSSMVTYTPTLQTNKLTIQKYNPYMHSHAGAMGTRN